MTFRIYWATYYTAMPSLWRWQYIGMSTGANLQAHYIFATRPTKRQLRQIRKGKCEARMQIDFH